MNKREPFSDMCPIGIVISCKFIEFFFGVVSANLGFYFRFEIFEILDQNFQESFLRDQMVHT